MPTCGQVNHTWFILEISISNCLKKPGNANGIATGKKPSKAQVAVQNKTRLSYHATLKIDPKPY